MVFMAATLFAILLVARWWAVRQMNGVRVDLVLGEPTQLGAPAPLMITVANEDRLPKLSLSVEPLASSRWIEAPGPSPVALAPGEACHLDAPLTPRRRGAFVLNGARIHSTDPMEIWRFATGVGEARELIVTPEPLATEPELAGAMAQNMLALLSAPRRGDAEEFLGLREYLPGDSLRRVHWPTTARTATLTVREHEREESRSLVLLIDRDPAHLAGTEPGTNFELAVSAAAGLVETAARLGAPVLVAGDGSPEARVGSAEETRRAALVALARIECDSREALDDLARSALRRAPGAAVALIALEPSAAVEAAVETLALAGSPISVTLIDRSAFDSRADEAWLVRADRFAAQVEALGASYRLVGPGARPPLPSH
jgi:uncharacterized protein (DUF58 family)